MKEIVEGIVISERSYGETSKILNIFTKEYGIIGVMAKGAKGLKSSLRSVTTKFTYGKFTINYKEGKLSILSSVDIIDPLKTVKKDLFKISYVSFITELSEQVYKQNNSSDIYGIFISALLKINENFAPLIITNIVELKYLYYLGVMPVLDSCAICGTKIGIVTLSATRGGYICKNCLTNEKLVSEKSIKLIRMFYYVDISKISNLEISKPVKIEINDFLDSYYDKYTGLYLKSKKLLQNLNKVE